jgi:hypothetical protein
LRLDLEITNYARFQMIEEISEEHGAEEREDLPLSTNGVDGFPHTIEGSFGCRPSKTTWV